MERKDGYLIFVTIGVPFSSIPIMTKVMVFVDAPAETDIQAAKKLRKLVADNIENHGFVRGTEFNPSDLYYEIYLNHDHREPQKASMNSRFWNQAA